MINQPESNIVLPEELQKALDAARNNITLGESEVVRLRDLRISEEVKIIELTKSKKWLEEENTRLLAEVNQKLNESNALLATLDNAKRELQSAVDEKTEIEKKNVEDKKVFEARDFDILSKEKILNEREADLLLKEIKLGDDEKKLAEKCER